MSLYRVLYCSRARLPEESAARLDALREIIARSEVNNRRAGLTGALLYTNRCFAQILEGEEDALAARFERIVADPRHHHIAVVAYAPAPSREFPDWSMTLLGTPQNEEEDALARLLLQEAFAPAPRSDLAEALLGYLHGLLHTAGGFAFHPRAQRDGSGTAPPPFASDFPHPLRDLRALQRDLDTSDNPALGGGAAVGSASVGGGEHAEGPFEGPCWAVGACSERSAAQAGRLRLSSQHHRFML